MYDELEFFVQNFDMEDFGIKLKYNHSRRVCNLSIDIAKKLGWNKEEIEIARLIGLLHDVGRFDEWQRMKTFKSGEDHANLGVKFLKKIDYFEKINIKEKDIENIYNAIEQHNKYIVLDELKNNKFVKLIRDADKIDILYIFSNNASIDNKYIGEKITPEVDISFMNEQNLNIKLVQTYGDYILYVLGFIYDINNDYCLKIINENKYIDKYYNILENKEKYKKYFEKANKYIERRIKNVK